jgi:hypothetical protein
MNFLNSVFQISSNYKLQEVQSRVNGTRLILVAEVEIKLGLQLTRVGHQLFLKLHNETSTDHHSMVTALGLNQGPNLKISLDHHVCVIRYA